MRISSCGAGWESWGCSATNSPSVSLQWPLWFYNQFPVVMTDDITEIVGFVGQALAIRRKELYVCSTNMYIFLTHEKLTAGNYFRCGGCRTTDSSCFPRNCHCPPAAPLPPRCGCWPVVVLSYQGRHASLGPPWGVWCWPWQRWGSWRGPQASKLHQTWCSWQLLPTWEVDEGHKRKVIWTINWLVVSPSQPKNGCKHFVTTQLVGQGTENAPRHALWAAAAIQGKF